MLEKYEEYKLYPKGNRFINGLSNIYDDSYDPSLEGNLSEEELAIVIKNLNEAIQKFWPCQPCFLFGVICAPLTIIPCFPTNYCIHSAEKAAHDILEQISLKAKFYDRRITFRLVKVGCCCCSSYVALRYPSHLQTSMISSVTTPLISKFSGDIEIGSDLVVTTAPGGHRKHM